MLSIAVSLVLLFSICPCVRSQNVNGYSGPRGYYSVQRNYRQNSHNGHRNCPSASIRQKQNGYIHQTELSKPFLKSRPNYPNYSVQRQNHELQRDLEYQPPQQVYSQHRPDVAPRRQVCYEPYGCFSNDPPFTNAGMMLPEPPEKLGIEFLLFTRRNPLNAQLIRDGDQLSIRRSNFDPSKNTKLISHGFTGSGHREWIVVMTAEFLLREDMNVIVIDWREGARVLVQSTPYDQSTANTRLVGAVTAELVKTLVQVGATVRKVHIIGFSLGGHVSGYAGDRLPGLARITGLDPASNNFEKRDSRVRLDRTDARFVDVIHSTLRRPMGDVDFYPAGGYAQPACQEKRNNGCNHEMAIYYFISSINGRCNFRAFPCRNLKDMKKCSATSCRGGCSTMGYNATAYPPGTFYVDVTALPPYC